MGNVAASGRKAPRVVKKLCGKDFNEAKETFN